MRKLIISLALSITSLFGFSATPDFSLVGFGAGTTGGQGGSTVTVTDYAGLAAEVVGTTAKIIQVSGTITGPSGGQILDLGSNKTIIGLGCNARIEMVQLHLKNSNNIIIRNITFTMIGSTLGSDADMICMETTSTNICSNVWIDHCEFYNIKPTLPETAAKKDLYDGMIDIKKSYSNITISWNYFHDHWKCNLIGFTDTDVYDRKITFHHNRWKNIKSRAPSYRGGTGHVYNNYYEGLLIEDESNPGVWTGTLVSTGIHTREQACLKVENNYFKDYDKTIYNDIADCTLEGYAHGSGNVFVNSTAQTAVTCSSFTLPYTYTMDAAADIPAIVTAYSGVGKIDGSSPTLSATTNASQTVSSGTAISSIVYTWGGTATDVTLATLPAGLTSSKNAGAKTLTITGTPTASGTYSVTTSGGSCGTTSLSGTITLTASTPSLTDPANKTQTVNSGTAIASIVFTWGGSATDVTLVNLPAGLTSVKDAVAKTLTISGTPTATGTYTVTTVGGTGSVVMTGVITVTVLAPSLSDPANKNQTVNSGTAIAPIVFTWGGGATDVTLANLPAGLTSVKNAAAKTLTLSGTPTSGSTYTVTTVGGSGAAVVVSGTVQIKICAALQVVSITGLASTGVYRLDLYNAAGTTFISTLTTGTFQAGNSDYLTSGLSAGTYTYKLMNGATLVKSGSVIIP